MSGATPPSSSDPTASFLRECAALTTKIEQNKLRIEQIEPAFERIKRCYEDALGTLRDSPTEGFKIRAETPERLSEKDLSTIYRATCERLLQENPKLQLEITTPILKSESPMLSTPSPDLNDDITRVVILDWEVTILLNSGTTIDPKLGTYGLEQSLNCLSKLHTRLETEIRDLKAFPELRPLLEDLFLKKNLLEGKIAEVRRNLCGLSIRDDTKFILEKDNPFYNAIIDDRITFHTRNLSTLIALNPKSPQISELKRAIAKLESLKSPHEEPPGNTQATFCKMNNLNIKCASLWRHLGFNKNFSHLSHFEKEHLSQALLRDIQIIKTTIREAEGISADPIFNRELDALKATLEVLTRRQEVINELLNDSTAKNKAAIGSYLLSGKGSATLSEDLRASIINELGFL